MAKLLLYFCRLFFSFVRVNSGGLNKAIGRLNKAVHFERLGPLFIKKKNLKFVTTRLCRYLPYPEIN